MWVKSAVRLIDVWSQISDGNNFKVALIHCKLFTPIRELLAFGNKREAVEWAMRNRAESHALYLALLMDAMSPGPTMGDVVARLEASLPANDPILTGKLLWLKRGGGIGRDPFGERAGYDSRCIHFSLQHISS